MASRILTCVSCTFYLCLLISITIIGFASLLIGAVGVGLYIPASKNYDNYRNNNCSIISLQYEVGVDAFYYVTWSVEYRIVNVVTGRLYTFSTITDTYETLSDLSIELSTYADNTTHSCYYDQTNFSRVQWTRPSSPEPYLIMLIVGFSLTGIYLILISIFYVWRVYDPNK